MKTWTIYRTSRRARTCNTHLGTCRGINAGERYSYSSLPPNSEMGNQGWWHLAECQTCANTYGRPFPTTPASIVGAPC